MKTKLFIFLLFSCTFLYAKQRSVCHNCEHTSISAAIQEADSGDLIRISEGKYLEHDLEVNKSLRIEGVGKVVIDGEFKGSVFHITADKVTIESVEIINVGFSFTKEFAAIHLYRVDSFELINNVLDQVFFGILIEKSHFGRIHGNRIRSNGTTEAGSGNGIHLWHSSHVEISYNSTSGLRDGIYFEFVDSSSIHHNESFNNLRYGLHFMFSNQDSYNHNHFHHNGAGVAVMFSKGIQMENNLFEKNWGTAAYGLLLKEIYDGQILNNTFSENTIAINVEGSSRISYGGNAFRNNGWAIKIVGACYTNNFYENDFLYNSFDLSYNTKMNDNRFDGNYWSEYRGYDLDRDGIGDVAYRPVKLFSYIVNKAPESIVLLRSLFIYIINFSEKVSPIFTPDDLLDSSPSMNQHHVTDSRTL